MRTATWEISAGALATLLNSKQPLNKADVYTFTLASGALYRLSGSDIALSFGGNTYGLGPGITRNKLRWVVGVEVSTLDITLTDNVGTQLGGQPLLAFIRNRGLYGARVQLDRVFWGVNDAGPVGTLNWFTGRVADMDVDRYQAKLQCKSDIELLDVNIPRDVYQPGCLNTLYDPICGVTRSSFTSVSTASSATDSRRITFSHTLPQAAGYFDLGVLTMASGANAGVSRTVKAHTSGQLTVLQPWPAPVASGDTFSVTAGCDKTLATCGAKFANALRFRGMPFIPVAETVI